MSVHNGSYGVINSVIANGTFEKILTPDQTLFGPPSLLQAAVVLAPLLVK